MNEAYDPSDTATYALLKVRLVAGMGEAEPVIDMYVRAANMHGMCHDDSLAAVAQGRDDRRKAEAAAATTLLTVDEIIEDLHLDLVEGYHRKQRCGRDIGTRYMVGDEHTLLYQYPGCRSVGIMAGKVSGRNWRDGTTDIGTFGAVREATLDDFTAFCVDPRGHLTKH
jgi:hypothetical protein